MRIIGYIEHPLLKITVFKMDNRHSIKFESGLYEQTYKFRDSDRINSLEDIQGLVDDPFVESVLEQFRSMHRLKTEALKKHFPPPADNEFDRII